MLSLPPRPPRLCGESSRAFTLVEIIVVVIILAVLAGLAAPRLLRSSARHAEAEALDASRLLTAAARRCVLAGETVAIEYDARAAQLSVLVRRSPSSLRHSVADWQPDPFVSPVLLQHTTVSRATADARELPRARWRVVLSPAEPRPDLWLLVSPADSRAPGAWQLELPPTGTSASVTPANQPPAAASAPRRIDLDAAQGDRAW